MGISLHERSRRHVIQSTAVTPSLGGNMRSINVLRIALVATTVAMFSTFALPQKWEVDPYAGGFFASNFANGVSLKKEGLYGVRGGYFLANNIEAEGNFGYINHFEFENAGHTNTRAWLWDANATYHFSSRLGK